MKKYTAISSIEMGISLLVIVAICTVLVLYFNPVKKIVDNRNNQRTEDLTKILNALTVYSKDNNGTLPDGIPVSESCSESEFEMCKSNGADCSGLVVLNGFSDNEKYGSPLPVDPKNNSANGTGYNIVQNQSGRVTVCAPKAEMGTEVSISR